MENMMKAAVLHGKKDLRMESRPRPACDAGEVLLKIVSNGLCGSDIHFFEHGKLGPFIVDKPYIPGHEAVGEIVEIGSKAKPGLKVGDRVVIEPGIPCNTCAFCREGRYNLCEDVVFLSAPPVDGTFADYISISRDAVHFLPQEIPSEIGALVEPASVAAHALNRIGVKPGNTVTILGAGPIGLITLLMAKAYGISEITIVDRFANRLSKAKELGASHTIDNSDNSAVEQILAITHGKGTKYVIDTTGSSLMCALAPSIVMRGGSIAIVGWPEKSSFPYPIESIIEKEINIVGINRYCNVFPQIISMLKVGQLDLSSIISHRFKFSEICEVLAFASTNRLNTYKIVIDHE